MMTAIEGALLAPFVLVDAWLRLAVPDAVALPVPMLLLLLAAGLVLLAVALAAHRVVVRGERLSAGCIAGTNRRRRRADRRTWVQVVWRPAGGRGPRAPGGLLAGS